MVPEGADSDRAREAGFVPCHFAALDPSRGSQLDRSLLR